MTLFLALCIPAIFYALVLCADLVQTAANVVASTAQSPQIDDGTALEAVAAGAPMFFDNSNAANTGWRNALSGGNIAQSGASALGVQAGLKIALTNSAAGQPVKLFRAGQINLGATLVVGQTYCVSTNSGKIAPVEDVDVTGKWMTHLGVALTAAILQTPDAGMKAYGIQHA